MNDDVTIRLVREEEISILYEHLKEFLKTENASTTGNPLPKFEDSERFVKKYLFNNENHEYDNWYIVLNSQNEIVGNVCISKKDMVSYHILKKYQGLGFGEKAVSLLIKENPREKYFATVNINNTPSINFIKKFGFVKKGYIFEKNYRGIDKKS